MPAFRFQAIGADGREQAGTIEAEGQEQAHAQLTKRGLIPLALEKGEADSAPWWSQDIELFGPVVRGRDIGAFFEMLATLLNAKLPLKAVLTYAHGQTKNRKLKSATKSLSRDVENGLHLSVAMDKHPQIFEPRFSKIIEIGERANATGVAAEQCARLIDAELGMRAEIRSALIYPAILLAMSLVVVAIVLFHLVPTMAPLFAQMNADVPASLSILLGLRNLLIGYWPVVIGALALTPFAILLFRKIYPQLNEAIVFHIPILKNLARDRASQSIATTITLMQKSGASLPEALHMAEGSVRWDRYKTLLQSANQTIGGGGRLSDALGNSDLLSPILRNMINVGETTNQLVPLLENASLVLQKAVSDRVQSLLRLLTPALTLIIGLGVGGMIFVTLSAIMDVNDVVF